jgi:acetyl-CoA synthetase
MSEVWQPPQEIIERAQVTKLIRQLGLPNYDALYQFSIENPAAYWQEVNRFLGIKWRCAPEAYVDLSEGLPFPKWFPGGALNWVDTILAYADDPTTKDQAAIVAESENGRISYLTYTELRQRVLGFAAGLRCLGLGRGDRIGLLMQGGIEAVISFLGISALGAIAAPLFSGFGVDAIRSRLSGCDAKAFIATAGFMRRGRFVDITAIIRDVRPMLPALQHLILLGEPPEGSTIPDAIPWAAIETTPVSDLPISMDPNDPMMVIYTSGTTGKPKGAVHTHGSFPLKIAHDAATHFDMGPGDRFCWPADMGWIAGSLILTSALMRGATLVCYDGAPDFPDWSRMLGLIERHQVSHYGASPTLIRALRLHRDQALKPDRSSLRLLITAGEGIDPEHFLWFQDEVGARHCPVINYTGGTEVSGGLLSNVVVRPIIPSGFNSISPGIRVDVFDTQGQSLRDAVGELAVLAPFVGMTQAFWRDRDRYLETYWSQFPDTWVHGDLAIRTKDDLFFLRGRSDDTLKIAGKRLGSAEVEEVLLGVAGVAEAAAIGVEDAAKGHALVVFLVPKPDAPKELPELAARAIEARLSRAFRPGAVHLLNELPKTRSQKLMRRVIRNIYTGKPPGDLTPLDNPTAIESLERLAAEMQNFRSG